MKILFVHNYYTRFLKHFLSENKEKIACTDYKSHKKLLFDQLFSVSDFYSQGVLRNGHEAIDVVANDWILQKKWAAEHGLRITTYPPIALESRIGQQIFLHTWMEKILEIQIKEYNPDIVYFLDIESFSFNLLKRVKKNKYTIIAQKASPILSSENYRMADIVFSALSSMVGAFQKKHIRSHYLPFAFEPSVLSKIPKQKKKYNCTFVGGFSKIHTLGNKLITEVSKCVHLDIFGYGKEMLPCSSEAYQNHHGEVWGKDMYTVLLQSNMTVNRHVDMAGEYAANIRLFEATGCGAMLLTDKKKNLGELFVDNKEVVSYTNADDLVDKIRYYTNHPRERDRIAKAGQRRTARDHTYTKRMKEVLKFL